MDYRKAIDEAMLYCTTLPNFRCGLFIRTEVEYDIVCDLIDDAYKNNFAMKGLQVTIDNVLDAILNDEWDEYVGKIENLGMESPDPAENYVQLPEETTQWDDTFTKEDYQKLVERMYNGEYEVSSDSTTFPETDITATDYGSIK